MNFHPLGERVAIELDKADEKTKGGIIIPETAARQGARTGRVVYVSPSPKCAHLTRGMRVVLAASSEYGETKFTIGERTLSVFHVDDLLAEVST